MADAMRKISCIDPNYLTKRYSELLSYHLNPPKRQRRHSRYHFISKKLSCHLLDTTNIRSGYKQWSLEAVGIKTSVNVAIFVYYMHHGMDRNSLPNIHTNSQISHLCHHKACINPDHLHLESAVVNNQRKACEKVKKCNGHQAVDGGEHPRCILY